MLFIIVFNSCYPSSYITKRVSEKCAIRRAERFIKKNGYTSKPLDTIKSSYREFFYDQFDKNQKEIVDKRFNSLYPKAYYVAHDREERLWYVGFISTRMKIEKLDSLDIIEVQKYGRTVIVNEWFHYEKIAHLKSDFSIFKKLR